MQGAQMPKPPDADDFRGDYYEAVFNGIGDAIFIHGVHKDGSLGRFLDVNPVACSRLGYTRSEFLAMTPYDIDDTAEGTDAAPMARKLASGENVIFEQVHVTRDGTRIPVEINARALSLDGQPAVLSIVRDIRERKRAHAKLVAQERMAAIGRLAAGAAHQFNNINAPIFGYADLILRMRDIDPKVRRWIETIRASAGRARDITESLLTFAEMRSPQITKAHDLNEIATETIRLFRTQAEGEEMEIHTCLRPLPPTLMDRGSIAQVLFNLILNAKQAMIGSARATLFVESGAVGDRIFLRISDNGCGIPEGNLDTLFTPFFSTKGEFAQADDSQNQVRGVGLGLSVALSLVQQHNGRIEIESKEGVGSTFTLWIPLNGEEGTMATETDPVQASPGDQERILLLDDDEATSNVVRDVMNLKGYPDRKSVV
jgi:PAS domain S-box-containing protein